MIKKTGAAPDQTATPCIAGSGAEARQCTIERLETSDEELSTVNQQLQNKLAELERSNHDLKNLLASSEIATLCLDREFRIKWFTPAMAKVLNVIASDVGRPISDLSHVLAGADLFADARSVLQNLTPVQKEFSTESHCCYIRRILPYRTEDDRIDGIIVTFTDISESKRAAEAAIEARKALTEILERQVRERTAQLRTLAGELALAEERERRKLAQDLHDDLGQLLAIAKIKLDSLDKYERRGNLKSSLDEVGELLDQAIVSVRSLVFQMSPPILYELGLVPAIEWLAEEKRRLYGLSVSVHDDGEPKPLDQAARSILFRALRELLINVAKHAGVGVAKIAFRRQGARLAITVTDTGAGFDPEAHADQGGFGLVSVRERLGYIGGDLHIDSAPGAGTAITLTAPLALEDDAKEDRP